MSSIEIVTDHSREQVDAAAQMWGEATPLATAILISRESRSPGRMIADVVSGSASAMLLTALSPDRQPLGFAAFEPATDNRAEIRRLGVRPMAWGHGIAALVLPAVASGLRGFGCRSAELWVCDDNDRAITVYETRQPDCPTRIHLRSGRRERHDALDLSTPDSRSI